MPPRRSNRVAEFAAIVVAYVAAVAAAFCPASPTGRPLGRRAARRPSRSAWSRGRAHPHRGGRSIVAAGVALIASADLLLAALAVVAFVHRRSTSACSGATCRAGGRSSVGISLNVLAWAHLDGFFGLHRDPRHRDRGVSCSSSGSVVARSASGGSPGSPPAPSPGRRCSAASPVSGWRRRRPGPISSRDRMRRRTASTCSSDGQFSAGRRPVRDRISTRSASANDRLDARWPPHRRWCRSSSSTAPRRSSSAPPAPTPRPASPTPCARSTRRRCACRAAPSTSPPWPRSASHSPTSMPRSASCRPPSASRARRGSCRSSTTSSTRSAARIADNEPQAPERSRRRRAGADDARRRRAAHLPRAVHDAGRGPRARRVRRQLRRADHRPTATSR